MVNKYEYVKKSVDRRRVWIDSLKTGPCSKCGIYYPPYVMDWHHVDRKSKLFSVSTGAFTKSRKTILDEIEKCILICANCHRILEHEIKYALYI